MDDSRQKNFFLIGFLFIVIIFINVFIKSVDLSAKPTKSSSLETNNNSVIPNKEIENSNNNEITNNKPEDSFEEKSYTNNSNSKYFYSSDDKYYLILTENERSFSNEEMGKTDSRYILNIDEYYSTNSFTGKYKIENGKITLFIEAGCKNEKGEFNCVIPDGIKINKIDNINTMTLDYNDSEIYLGNIKLSLKN